MKKKILSLTLCAALLGGMSTSVCAAAEDYSEGEIHTIGVAMYDPDSAEMEMFGDYYRDYIEEGFPVRGKGKRSRRNHFIRWVRRWTSGCHKDL